MSYIIVAVVALVVGFVGGFLFARKHGDRVAADIQNVKDTAKAL